jgi:hypothetical protein
MASVPRFYVYVLARPNGKPFYVGKGQGRRVYDHEREARNGHQCHKCNVIRKIWRKGGEVQRYTVFTTDDERAALDYEVSMIALYGRRTLCNLTDGGDGVSNPSEETRARMRAAYTRKSPEERAEHRRKLSEAHKGVPYPEERRLKQIGRRVAACSEERKQRISKANSGKVRTKEALENQSRAHRKGQIYTMIAPDGTIYEDIDSMVGFGKAHGMGAGTVRNILRGSKNRMGWRGFIRKKGGA